MITTTTSRLLTSALAIHFVTKLSDRKLVKMTIIATVVAVEKFEKNDSSGKA